MENILNKLMRKLKEEDYGFLKTYDKLTEQHLVCVKIDDRRMLEYTFDRHERFLDMNVVYCGVDAFAETVTLNTLNTAQFEYLVYHDGTRKAFEESSD